MGVESMPRCSGRGSSPRAVRITALLTMLFLSCAQSGWAQDGAFRANTTDTAWMLVSAAFVMLMTPGLAMFYG
jgi:ammonium transporter, Amt family